MVLVPKEVEFSRQNLVLDFKSQPEDGYSIQQSLKTAQETERTKPTKNARFYQNKE